MNRASVFSDREALVFAASGYRRSYRELEAEVSRCAKGLVALGIERGQHVAIWATNVPQWPLLQLATARIGAVLVTINPAYRAFELEYVLRQSDAVALFLVDRFKTSDYFAMLGEVCPELSGATPNRLQTDKFSATSRRRLIERRHAGRRLVVGVDDRRRRRHC